MKRAALLLLVAAILGILWLGIRGARSGRSTESENTSGQESSASSRASLEARTPPNDTAREVEKGAPSPESHEAATSIRVRSSVGLPLAFAEIQVGEEPWQRRDLKDGDCELADVALPCRLRAPGHSPATVDRLGVELVLEPDALLVIEAPGLRGCVESIEPYRHFLDPSSPSAAEFRARLAHAWAFGFVDEDHWSIAITSKLLADFDPSRQLQISTQWSNRQRADIVFDARPQARANWSTTCPGGVEVAPLDVTLVWPEGVKPGAATLRLGVMHDGQPPEAEHLEFEWGKIVVSPPVNSWLERRLNPNSDHVSIGLFPTGVRCALAVTDAASGAYGGMIFEHDGSPRTLVMRPALAISGRITVPREALLPVRARFSWQYVGPSEGRYNWMGSEHDASIGEDGAFEVRGLTYVPIGRTPNLDPPSTLELAIEAPGFERFEKSYSTGGASRFDCGTIELVPGRPRLMLAPGKWLEDFSFGYGPLIVSSRPEVGWEVQGPRREVDGSTSVILTWDKEDGKEGYRCWIDPTGGSIQPFPESPGEFAVLVDSTGERGVGLRRGADGRYGAVAMRRCKVEVDCRSMPSSGDAWILGWKWQGMSVSTSRVTPEFEGEHTSFDIVLPEDGATLWWTGEAGEGGSMPAAGSPIRLTLP